MAARSHSSVSMASGSALALINSISISGSTFRVSAARYSRMGGATGAQPNGRGGLIIQSFMRAFQKKGIAPDKGNKGGAWHEITVESPRLTSAPPAGAGGLRVAGLMLYPESLMKRLDGEGDSPIAYYHGRQGDQRIPCQLFPAPAKSNP